MRLRGSPLTSSPFSNAGHPLSPPRWQTNVPFSPQLRLPLPLDLPALPTPCGIVPGSRPTPCYPRPVRHRGQARTLSRLLLPLLCGGRGWAGLVSLVQELEGFGRCGVVRVPAIRQRRRLLRAVPCKAPHYYHAFRGGRVSKALQARRASVKPSSARHILPRRRAPATVAPGRV